ncbi:hypothetical protein [Tepidibacillus marianensis]|uniref:hypothetical protein n=1 Tax=Tepidibacillus marianensis TaxID=3131995 RepID=UPI0030D06AEE
MNRKKLILSIMMLSIFIVTMGSTFIYKIKHPSQIVEDRRPRIYDGNYGEYPPTRNEKG